MPKVAKELSALAVKRIHTPGMHPVGKVAGLNLQVTATGSRSWILRIMVGSRRKEIGLGSYPAVSLADAHERAQVERDKVRAGIDPVTERRAAEAALRTAQASEITFIEATKKFIAGRSHEWKNAKHGDQWKNTLVTYADPIIGKTLVRHITREHVVQILSPIWTTKTETASRVRGRIEAVLDWAKVSGYRSGENPATWRGNLDHLLSKPNKIKQVRNHPALPKRDMAAFMEGLRAIDAAGARCLEFAILTATRSGEVRGARWSEIDLDECVWTVPAERMKARKEHRVPLSTPAIKLINAMPREKDRDLIFIGPSGRALSDMTLLMLVRRQGVDAVPHGFRSTFRDWAADSALYPSDLAEKALAHAVKSKVEAAYQRGDLLERRRAMMEDWAKFIATPYAKGTVIPMQRQA